MLSRCLYALVQGFVWWVKAGRHYGKLNVYKAFAMRDAMMRTPREVRFGLYGLLLPAYVVRVLNRQQWA